MKLLITHRSFNTLFLVLAKDSGYIKIYNIYTKSCRILSRKIMTSKSLPVSNNVHTYNDLIK